MVDGIYRVDHDKITTWTYLRGIVTKVVLGTMTPQEAGDLWSKYPNYRDGDILYWVPPKTRNQDFAYAWQQLATYGNITDPEIHCYIMSLVGQGYMDQARAKWGKIVSEKMVPEVVLLDGVATYLPAAPKPKTVEEIPTEDTPTETPLNTVQDDVKEMALRSGVKKLREKVLARITAFITTKATPRISGETDIDYETRVREARKTTERLLNSEAGQGILSYLLGFSWSFASDHVGDPKLREFGDLVAKELRIQGGVGILDETINELIAPLFAEVRHEMNHRVDFTLPENEPEALPVEEIMVLETAMQTS